MQTISNYMLSIPFLKEPEQLHFNFRLFKNWVMIVCSMPDTLLSLGVVLVKVKPQITETIPAV